MTDKGLGWYVKDGEIIDPDLDVTEQLGIAQIIEITRNEMRRELVAVVEDHIANLESELNNHPYAGLEKGAPQIKAIEYALDHLRCVLMLIERVNVYGENAKNLQIADYAKTDAETTKQTYAILRGEVIGFSIPAHPSKDD